MQHATILRAYRCYGFNSVQLLGQHKGYRNTSYTAKLPNGETVNLILYKHELGMRERIDRIHAVSARLKEYAIPVRTTYDPRILTIRARDTARYAVLYAYLPGSTIPWEAYTKHHIKLLGMAMGYMHAALVGLPISSPLVADEYIVACNQMTTYFESSGVKKALQQKLHCTLHIELFNSFQTILTLTKKLPNQHMLHMDFVRGNVLFDNAEGREQTPLQVGNFIISGILDLEKTAYGHPVFDIARTLAFLLVDSKYKPPEKVKKYFLNSGYAKRGKQKIPNITYSLDGKKIDVLEVLTDLFLVYDFYKFLRHNPYESLHENEHFVRTRTMLVEKGIVENL